MKMIKSALSVAVFTIFSRITGFLRDILLAKFIGTGIVMDALVIAIKVPSFLRRIFAEGAFNSSFVPIFSSLNVDKKEAAKKFVQDIFSLMSAILIVVIIVFEIFMPAIIGTIFQSASAEMLPLAIKFSRLTFPFILLISLVALFSGVLNSLDRFAAAASSQMMANIFIALGLLIINPAKIAEGSNVAILILGSGIVQLIWILIPCYSLGIRPALKLPRITPEVRKFGRKMIPAAIGSGILQINLIIDMVIASFLPAGTFSYLYYSERLYNFPISITGTAMGTVLLPLLSRLWREKNHSDGLYYQNRAIEFSMLITFPAMLTLIMLSHPIVFVLFARGKFDAIAGAAVAHTVMGFATGLPAYILIKIFSSNFFARHDTLTPIKVAIFGMLANVIFNLLLIPHFQHVGIALATSIAAWLNAGVLFIILLKNNAFRFDKKLFVYIFKLSCITFITGVLIYVLNPLMMEKLHSASDLMDKIQALSIVFIPSAVTFLILSKLSGCLVFQEYIKRRAAS